MSRFEFDQTSPPVVFKDHGDRGEPHTRPAAAQVRPAGTVQAFDARTGERRWVFFTIPQSSGDDGADTWEDEAWRFTGHANVWGLMSLDVERGLLYVPTSTPSSDYWGGTQGGREPLRRGRWCAWMRARVSGGWHFQAVHQRRMGLRPQPQLPTS